MFDRTQIKEYYSNQEKQINMDIQTIPAEPIAGKKIIKNTEIIKMKWECLAGCILAQTPEEFYFCWSRGHDQTRNCNNVEWLVNAKHSIWQMVQQHPYIEPGTNGSKGAPKLYSNELIFTTIKDVLEHKVTSKELRATFNGRQYSNIKNLCLGRIKGLKKRGVEIPFTAEQLEQFKNTSARNKTKIKRTESNKEAFYD